MASTWLFWVQATLVLAWLAAGCALGGAANVTGWVDRIDEGVAVVVVGDDERGFREVEVGVDALPRDVREGDYLVAGERARTPEAEGVRDDVVSRIRRGHERLRRRDGP